MNTFSLWLSQNWLWLILIGMIVYFGWYGWPRMQPNPRRWVAGGMGLSFLTVILARLAGGLPFDAFLLVRAVFMGLAGILLVLAANYARLQNSLWEYAGWAVLIAVSLVSLFFRNAPWVVQGIVILVAAGLGVLLQYLVGNAASEWK